MKTSKRKRWVEYSGNLRRRAWVFQEYNLSPCTILYNTNGLAWECREGCHYDSEVISEENQFRRETRALKNFPLQLNSIIPSSPVNMISEIMAVWRGLVNEYSKKELTVETDMLPALSGLASLVQAATGDQYLAGIWRCDLPAALRWVPESPDWRSTEYLAPTWSWAACKKSCPIVYTFSSATLFTVEILDAEVSTDKDNPFGRVSDGFLKLEGLIQRGTIKRSGANSLALEVVLETNRRRIRHPVGYIVEHDSDISALPPICYLQLCIQSLQIFPEQSDDVRWHGLLVLEEDVRENVFWRLAYLSWLMNDADWAGAERKVIIIK